VLVFAGVCARVSNKAYGRQKTSVRASAPMSPRTLRQKNAHGARVATNDKNRTAPIGFKGRLEAYFFSVRFSQSATTRRTEGRQGRTVCYIRPPGIADASLEPVAFVAAHRLGREIARCTFRSGRLVAESDTGTGPKPIIIGPRGCNTVKCAGACAYHELASIGCVPTTRRRSRVAHLVRHAKSAAGI
jgi:hypothetical protein